VAFPAFLWPDPSRRARIKEAISVYFFSILLCSLILNFCFGFDELSFDLQLNQLGLQKYIFPLNMDDIISSDIPDLQIRWPLEPLDLNRSSFFKFLDLIG